MSVCLAGWMVNAITAANINRFQTNFVSRHYFSKLSLGLKMGIAAPPILVPPIQIEKSGRLVIKQDNSRKSFPIATKICQYPWLIKPYDTVEKKFVATPLLVPPIQIDILAVGWSTR